MEECKSAHLIETQSFNCRLQSPISVLEPSFSTESFESSFSTDAANTEGNSSTMIMLKNRQHVIAFKIS